MSFGVGVGDFLAVGNLCWKVYKKCKEAAGSYAELSQEVIALHGVIKETEELFSRQVLNARQKATLRECQNGCESVLIDLDELLVKYKSLGTNSRRTFDRLGYGMQDIISISQRLVSSVTLLNVFIDASSFMRLEERLNALIDEVRAGKREGSVISTSTFRRDISEDRRTWESLRRELEDVGISSTVIAENQQYIVEWFQEAIATGNLEEIPPADDDSGISMDDLYRVDSSADGKDDMSDSLSGEEDLANIAQDVERPAQKVARNPSLPQASNRLIKSKYRSQSMVKNNAQARSSTSILMSKLFPKLFPEERYKEKHIFPRVSFSLHRRP